MRGALHEVALKETNQVRRLNASKLREMICDLQPEAYCCSCLALENVRVTQGYVGSEAMKVEG
jgi:hypothetical protein